jgi:hypothetical protein
MELTIKEELKWVYVVYRGDVVWRVYQTEAEARDAIVKINLNMQQLTKKGN